MSRYARPLLIDQRGTAIKDGARVAFNLSGTVAEGTVVRIAESMLYGKYPRWVIHVRLAHDAQGKKPGDVSKVTSPFNLLVLT